MLSRVEQLLNDLDQATLAKERTRADLLARELESIEALKPKKSILWYIGEFILAIVVALVVATCVRVMWFEPYKIPTGSMRPTFEEQAHLLVSKTAFGINIPLQTAHFLFEPWLVERAGVLTWSGDNIDLPDTDTVYFWVFPGKKRYIKRCMGLPGDTLYFYGGRIYGVDKDGNDVTPQLLRPGMEKLEWVPFNTFEGRLSIGKGGSESSVYDVLFRQFNRPVGRFSISAFGIGEGQLYNGAEWVKEDLKSAAKPHDKMDTYTDFLGMRNFAMARLLSKQEVKAYSNMDPSKSGDAELFLELRHNPNLTTPKPRVGEGPVGQLRVALTPFVTVIPIDQSHMHTLMQSMYTSRFEVKNGYATTWQIEGSRIHTGSPELPGVPDGTYEFYYGKAYEVGWTGIRYELPADHPLYQVTVKNLQFLFNLGMELNTAFAPFSADQLYFPPRYAYFREGDLFVMGAPLFTKDDATLQNFVKDEATREAQGSTTRPYVAFRDNGPPLKDGKLDVDFIRTFGLTVPDKQYVVLGDNHARSADSRTFGFVPEANLQGAPSFILWPPGSRMGLPEDVIVGPTVTLPRVIVWSIVILLLAIWFIRDRRMMSRPLYRKVS